MPSRGGSWEEGDEPRGQTKVAVQEEKEDEDESGEEMCGFEELVVPVSSLSQLYIPLHL